MAMNDVLREINRRVVGEEELVVLDNGETVRVRKPPKVEVATQCIAGDRG